MRLHHLRLAATLTALVWGPACVLNHPPSTFPKRPRGYVHPITQQFRIAVLNFVDQTGNATEIGAALPDAMSTAIHAQGRFALYDRGQLRQLDRGQLRRKDRIGARMLYEPYPTRPPFGVKQSTDPYTHPGVLRSMLDLQADVESLKTLRRQVDAVLVGAITVLDDRSVSVDYRLIGAVFQHVIYARKVRVKYSNANGVIRFDSAILRAEAKELANHFPEPQTLSKVKILNIRGHFVTLDVGERRGVFPGLSAYAYSPRAALLHPTATMSIPEDIHRGQIYITAVYDRTCQAYVFQGLGNLRVGDHIRFK